MQFPGLILRLSLNNWTSEGDAFEVLCGYFHNRLDINVNNNYDNASAWITTLSSLLKKTKKSPNTFKYNYNVSKQ